MRAQIADTLGWIYHLLGNDGDAIKFLTLARQGDPSHPLIHLHLAVVEAANGRLPQAQTALQTAFELDPGLKDTDDAKKLQAQLSEK